MFQDSMALAAADDTRRFEPKIKGEKTLTIFRPRALIARSTNAPTTHLDATSPKKRSPKIWASVILAGILAIAGFGWVLK